MTKADKTDDALADVLGEELASKLRPAGAPSPTPGPAPWDDAKAVPATVPPTELETPAVAPPSPEPASAAPAAAPAQPAPTPPAQPTASAPTPTAQPAPDPPATVSTESTTPAEAPPAEHHEIERRATDDLLAEVSPMRSLGKRHARWAQDQLWPTIKSFPSRVLAPMWRRALHALDLLRLKILAWPRTVKIAVASAIGVVVVAVLVLVLAPWSDRRFVLEPVFLHAGPSAEGFARAGVLQAREPVDVLDEAGTMVLVIDSVGRVGYLDAAVLADEAPTATPEQPFTRCGLLPGETEPAACESRAETQRAECLLTCEAVTDVAACTGNCEAHKNACVAGCAAALVPTLPAGVEPEPEPVAAEPEPLEEPAVEASDEVEPTEVEPTEPVEPVKPKKKKRKKKKRKKKRR